MINVLFVCLGNICRSPLAEGIFKNLVKEKGFSNEIKCDSAGTANYHIGKNPDHRSCTVAKKYEIELEHKARQFLRNDFESFDYVIAMDRNNYDFIKKLKSCDSFGGKLHLMREFDLLKKTDFDVPDPYYGGIDGFEHVYEMLLRSCKVLLEHIIIEKNLDAVR